MAIWEHIIIYLVNCGADYLCNNSTISFVNFTDATYVLLGWVSELFVRWLDGQK